MKLRCAGINLKENVFKTWILKLRNTAEGNYRAPKSMAHQSLFTHREITVVKM